LGVRLPLLPSLRRRPIGRTTGCYPVDAGSSPAVAAFTPRSSSRSRMPVSQTGDAGSSPARGITRSRTRLGMRPGCLPGEAGSIPVESASAVHMRVRPRTCPYRATSKATRGVEVARHVRQGHVRGLTLLLSPSLSGRAPRSYRGRRGFDSSRRDCVARLVASPRVVSPWSRVRFPGDAPFRAVGNPLARISDRAKSSEDGRFAALCLRHHLAASTTTGRLGRHRSDKAEQRGSIPRSSTPRTPLRPRPGQLLAVGELGHPAGFGPRRSQVRLLPARSHIAHRAVEERLSSRAS
jgi:hypothetical protein